MHEELANAPGHVFPAQMPFCLELTGPLDSTLLKTALASLICRHDALRTTLVPNQAIPQIERKARLNVFASCGLGAPGLYYQAVLGEPGSFSLPIEDVTRAGRLGQKVEELLLEDLSRPFDYARPPLLRARLLRIDACKHLLVLVVSTLVCDLWSLRILHLDLAKFYDEASNPNLPRTPGRVLQFHRFVLWQYQQAREGQFEADVEFWRQQWVRFESAQIWYRDIPFAQRQRHSGTPGIERLFLDSAQSRRIRRFADNTQFGMRSTVLAAFAAWLARVTDKQMIALNMMCLNRSLPEHENTVGWFSNTHLIGLEIPTGTTSAKLIARAHAALLDAEAHQAIPPAFLWNRLGGIPKQGDASIFFTFISSIGLPPVCTQDGVSFLPRPIPDIPGLQSPVGLSFVALDSEEGLLLTVNYSLDRFRPADIQEMLRSLKETLNWMSEHPQEPYSQAATEGVHD